MVFLHNRETQLAIDTLKLFENRDIKANSASATMLSFIYYLVSKTSFKTNIFIFPSFDISNCNFQQRDYDQAEKYGEAARNADTYNASAYVNLSACAIRKNELNIARELLLCALETDASHVQALYNLGKIRFSKNNFLE